MIALISLSEGKWVNKVKSVALLSPVAYLSHMTTTLGIMSANHVSGKVCNLFSVWINSLFT